MAKRYLRIANRGECPRVLLEILGATTKREAFQDPSQGGWFGSGTIYAPIAAHNLGVRVRFMSHDAHGYYDLKYRTVRVEEHGLAFDRIALDYGNGPERTPFSTFGAMNWTEAIGSDDKRSFRVLREYLRNAKDADPAGPYLELTDECAPPAKGWTYVYLTATAEFLDMLKNRQRYFKYLSKTAPLFVLGDVGAVYPKSEEDVTRIFSLGTLAECRDSRHESSIFDYDLYRKEILTEERTFKGTSDIVIEMSKILGALDEPELVERILRSAIASLAYYETNALRHLRDPKDIPARDVWLAAWRKACGEKAVIATDAYSDEIVRHQGMPAVTVPYDLREFLEACGVRKASDLVPKLSDYQTVDPTEAQKRNLDHALEALRKEGLLLEGAVTAVMRARPHVKKPAMGLCVYTEEPVQVYVRDAVCDTYDACLETLIHEHRHGRSKARDDERKFVDMADKDIARKVIEGHGRPEPPEEEVLELTDEDIDFFLAEDVVPGTSAVAETGQEDTEKSLDLIQRMIDEAKPEPPD